MEARPLRSPRSTRRIYSSHRWPWFLPDGKHFLYIAVKHNAPISPETAVFLASVDGKENRLLLHTLSNAMFASGRLLYQRENSLVTQVFDPSSGKFSGDPETLSENVQFDSGLWRMNLSASNDGMLVYASGTTTWERDTHLVRPQRKEAGNGRRAG